MPDALESLPDDPAILREMLLAERVANAKLAASNQSYKVLIQALELRIVRL